MGSPMPAAPEHWVKLVPGPAAALVRSLRGDGVPRKRARAVAALFVDIEGCTHLCEDLPPRQMNEVIERYFSAYLDAIRRAGGEVTEVQGDGLLGLFEGEALRDVARAALGAAREIETRTRELPEASPLYRTVEAHLDPFLARTAGEEGRSLPSFVTRELKAFLRCGLLEHGCLHVRCERCEEEMVVAFSCKGRGFCPSCGGRRMSELAAHLVDRVIPDVPVRQWVLSLKAAGFSTKPQGRR